MNLLFFIRLLLRHALLLIAMPIVLVVMVFMLTEDQPKVYQSNTRVYTGIATGSSIVSMESSKLDLFATNAAFDNLINIIKLRTTMEEVGINLLATHLLLEKSNPEIISAKSLAKLNEIVPAKVRDLVVPGDLEKTVEQLYAYKHSNYTNFIYELLNYDHPHYSTSKISSKLKVRRVQSSDLVEISYESSDPGICKNTLDIFCRIFITNYTNIKVNQSDAVVKYFQAQIALSTKKLNDAENELLDFNRTNSIINYYEQTRHIAAEKELFNNKHLEIKLLNAGSARVIEVLESKMSTREKQRVTNEKIHTLRKELAQVNLDIAMKTFEEQAADVDEQQLIEEIGELRTRAYDIEQQLRLSVGEQYYIDNSTEGVPTETVLIEWVEKVAEYESTKAQLVVAEAQNLEFDKLFTSYAPLGATMKRLERKIDVAEKEYLSLLYSLGVAKLKQQNVELNSNLKIVAEPLFPIVAQPSKRKFLLAVAFIIGFFIPAFVVILLEFLDRNLKSQIRAQEFIGLQVAAIFPNLARVNRKIDIDSIKSKSLQIIARRLILNAEQNGKGNEPETNIIFSSLEAEGKTMLMLLLLGELAKIGYKVLFLTYQETEQVEGVEIKKYKIGNSFHKRESIADLDADFTGIEMNTFDYVFAEIPGIRNNPYPINLFKNTKHSFMVTRANRAWTKADKYSLKDILEHCGGKEPQILLNGVEFQEMEDVIGDLPRKRSSFRSKMKDVFRLQFFNKKSLLTPRAQKKMKKRSKRNKPTLLLLLLSVVSVSALFLFARFSKPVPEAGMVNLEQIESIQYKTDAINPELITVPVAEIETEIEKPVDIEINETKETKQVKPIAIQTSQASKFNLIGGSFSSVENATNFKQHLMELGFSPKQVKKNSKLYTVLIGVYNTKAEANSALQQYLKTDPSSKAWVWEGNF